MTKIEKTRELLENPDVKAEKTAIKQHYDLMRRYMLDHFPGFATQAVLFNRHWMLRNQAA